jgi:hypothetical protein
MAPVMVLAQNIVYLPVVLEVCVEWNVSYRDVLIRQACVYADQIFYLQPSRSSVKMQMPRFLTPVRLRLQLVNHISGYVCPSVCTFCCHEYSVHRCSAMPFSLHIQLWLHQRTACHATKYVNTSAGLLLSPVAAWWCLLRVSVSVGFFPTRWFLVIVAFPVCPGWPTVALWVSWPAP